MAVVVKVYGNLVELEAIVCPGSEHFVHVRFNGVTVAYGLVYLCFYYIHI
jgi:hypothetical protein